MEILGSPQSPALQLIHRLVAGGIALAVAMLLVTVAVMQGFWGSYVNAARQFHGDLILVENSDADYPKPLMQALKDDPATATITAATSFLMREGLLTGQGRVQGVIIKAIDWASFSIVHPELRIRWLEPAGEVGFQFADRALPVILGRALSGETLPTHLFLPTPRHPNGESLPIRVVGEFESGLYDYDHQFIFVPRAPFAATLGLAPDRVNGVELRLAEPEKFATATQVWQQRFPEATITNWSELNQNMFDALRLQRTTFVVLMSLFVLIAVSNIVSVVGLQVWFRRRDGAVLRLLGMPLSRLRRLIGMASVRTSLLGIATGTALGLILIRVLQKTALISLPESVYFVKQLPLHLDPIWAAAILLGAVLVSLLVVWAAVARLAAIPILRGLWRT